MTDCFSFLFLLNFNSIFFICFRLRDTRIMPTLCIFIVLRDMTIKNRQLGTVQRYCTFHRKAVMRIDRLSYSSVWHFTLFPLCFSFPCVTRIWPVNLLEKRGFTSSLDTMRASLCSKQHLFSIFQNMDHASVSQFVVPWGSVGLSKVVRGLNKMQT